MSQPALFFSDTFGLDQKVLEEHDAFDVSLVCDLPLFIDPFLIFHSAKLEYQQLHEEMINYLRFLRDRTEARDPTTAELQLWYCFPEVRQNWLGFSRSSNRGSGLGLHFARTFHASLGDIFRDLSPEGITASNHIEKVGLIRDGIGRDTISDFATNLILGYLCNFTAQFAAQHISTEHLREVTVAHAAFNFSTETWERRRYRLPYYNGDHIILTPRDMLTRGSTWINRRDMLDSFNELPAALTDKQLRTSVSNYFLKRLADLKPASQNSTAKLRLQAAADTIRNFPELVDCYVRLKEERGDEALQRSSAAVTAAEELFLRQIHKHLLPALGTPPATLSGLSVYEETHARLAYLKHVIENRGGWRIFYLKGKAIEREADVQILFKLVWCATTADVSSEVNDGRGPADFKISSGCEKAIVEFKLARSQSLKVNLQIQAETYRRSSRAQSAIWVIVFFTVEEEARALAVLRELGLTGSRDVVLIDARRDNKQSASIVVSTAKHASEPHSRS